MENNLTRLNKFISESGACSRRDADKIIADGLVTINGKVGELGSKVGPEDIVKIDGKTVEMKAEPIYLAFHKPVGVVCTTDLREKNNIIEYIGFPTRIFPIGRLDKPSEGLIFLTNDGEIVNKILRATNHHQKEYLVAVNKAITNDFLKSMREGVPILDTVTLPCFVEKISTYVFRIVLTQGLNRQIRRMCEFLDVEVMQLKRVRIMNINLDNLPVGKYRRFTPKEVKNLQELLAESVKNLVPIEADAELSKDKEMLISDTPSTPQGKVIVSKDKKFTNRGKSYPAKERSFAPKDKPFERKDREFTPRDKSFSPKDKPFERKDREFTPRDKSFSPKDKPFERKDREFTPRDKSFSPKDKPFERKDREFTPRDKSFSPKDKPFERKDREFTPRDKSFSPKDKPFERKDREFTPRDRSFSPKDKPFERKDREFTPRDKSFSPKDKPFERKDREFTPRDRSFSPKDKPFERKDREFTPRDRSFSPKDKPFERKDREFTPRDRSFAPKDKPFERKDREFTPRDKSFSSKDKPFERKDKPANSHKPSEQKPFYSNLLDAKYKKRR